MLNVLVAFLTLVLVVDSIVLIFLVLIQLPKKEAGAGLAFGGAATDALFGAGSGTVLTKITKYAAGTFFVLAILLAMIQSRRSTSDFERRLQKSGTSLPTSSAPANPGQTAPAAPAPGVPLISTSAPAATPPAEAPAPAPVTAPTNAPAAPQ